MAGNSTRVVVVAFVMNLGIAVAKYIAFLVTGSAAMLAESVHSLADTVNQIFLFLGIRRSAKAASPSHQFGYGMEQYVFSFLVAILIFSLGGPIPYTKGRTKSCTPPKSWNTPTST
ncbi:MAG: cation transporter [Bacteroidetes bacterium]|nr:cation transporter [Bacteroidota bacterium]